MNPPGGGVNTPNFPENCMKSKEFGCPGGRASLTPPPRSANADLQLNSSDLHLLSAFFSNK